MKKVPREYPTVASLKLENAYREAAFEYDETWESAASDGIDDETW